MSSKKSHHEIVAICNRVNAELSAQMRDLCGPNFTLSGCDKNHATGSPIHHSSTTNNETSFYCMRDVGLIRPHTATFVLNEALSDDDAIAVTTMFMHRYCEYKPVFETDEDDLNAIILSIAKRLDDALAGVAETMQSAT